LYSLVPNRSDKKYGHLPLDDKSGNGLSEKLQPEVTRCFVVMRILMLYIWLS